jgi:hypothetical protein
MLGNRQWCGNAMSLADIALAVTSDSSRRDARAFPLENFPARETRKSLEARVVKRRRRPPDAA